DHRVVINYFSRKEKADALIAECQAIAPVSKPILSDTSSTPHTIDSHDSSGGMFHDNESPRFHVIQADLSIKADAERLVKETLATMGRLDVIVSNQGWTKLTDFMQLDQQVDEDMWDRCFNVNVKSHLWLLYAAREALEKSPGGGSFVSIASLAGVRASGSSLPYSVTNAAQIHLIKGLATICGPKIRCNSVSPGLMLTEWGMKFSEEKRNAAANKAAGKALAEVEDVAESVAMLVRNRALTGQNLVVDCGIAI
ncbi:hypothetical protein LTR66_016593, partial [Elasticomyces elasticus]